MKKLMRFLPIVTLFTAIVTISGCASLHHSQPAKQLTAADYLQLAQQTQGTNKYRYQIKAIDAYLTARQSASANQLIDSLNNAPLPPELRSQLQLQKIQVLLATKQTKQALTMLASFNPETLTPDNQQRYYTLYANAYAANGEVIQSINMRTTLASMLTDPSAQKQNLWVIWENLQTLSQEQLQSDANQTPSTTLRGWFTLTLLTKQYESQPDQLMAAIKKWQATYPDHPGNALLPKDPTISANLAESPKKIALLVPLTGPYHHYGQAIRNGFFAAYFDQKKRLGIAPSIRVYDTANQNILAVYQEAVTEGANFIVGPLQKQNLQSLVDHHALKVPTLSLNTLSTNNQLLDNNLYEFGLSPQDEAQQAALEAFNTHHQHVLIIAKDDPWSQSVVDAFTSQWKTQGGTVIATQWFKRQTFSTDIRNLLGIQQAYQDKEALQNVLQERMRYLPRRRQDFDSIFLVASPDDAKQILPLLRFYFANNVPVFSISQIYNNRSGVNHNRDLDGVYFCDIPWLLFDNNTLKPAYLNDMRTYIKSVWGQQYEAYPRFYALGVDAFEITRKLNKMTMLPDLNTLGATGTLSITPSHHIYRQLPFAIFTHGKPQPINS